MLDDTAMEAAARAVAPLSERLGLAEKLAPFAAHAWHTDAAARPTLHIDDVSGIPFLDGVLGVEKYQHRARLRAEDGDLFAAVTEVTDGYEEYCRDVLGLGRVTFVPAEPVAGMLQVARACAEGEAFEILCARAREAGALSIHPYMGIEDVWDLARKIARKAGVPVSVLAPPPPVTWLANDKALFSETVRRVLGDRWLLETRASADPAEMARILLDLAGRHRRVGLKRTRCASAMGNQVMDGAPLAQAGLEGVATVVKEFLARTRWEGDEEVLCVAWEDAATSPSTQIWIPPRGEGRPRLDGVYEQILEGPEKVFVGSRPSSLPQAVDRAMAKASLAVAAGFQALGYVGRCSFDLVVLGDPQGEHEIRFTECNGRWGGTSTPMHLVDRLTGRPRPPYRAQDVMHEALVGRPFREILAAAGDELYNARTGRGRFAFYNVGPLKDRGKLDVVAMGATQPDAEDAMIRVLPRLLGL